MNLHFGRSVAALPLGKVGVGADDANIQAGTFVPDNGEPVRRIRHNCGGGQCGGGNGDFGPGAQAAFCGSPQPAQSKVTLGAQGFAAVAAGTPAAPGTGALTFVCTEPFRPFCLVLDDPSGSLLVASILYGRQGNRLAGGQVPSTRFLPNATCCGVVDGVQMAPTVPMVVNLLNPTAAIVNCNGTLDGQILNCQG